MHFSTILSLTALVATTIAVPLELDARQGYYTYGPSWLITNYDGRGTSPAGSIIHFNITYSAPQPTYDEPSFTAYCEYNSARGGEQLCPLTKGERTRGVFASDNPVPGRVGINLRHSFQTTAGQSLEVTGGFIFDFSTPQPADPFEVTDLKIEESS